MHYKISLKSLMKRYKVYPNKKISIWETNNNNISKIKYD